MPVYLELRRPSGVELVALEGDRVTIGADASNGAVVDGDDSVSRLHAVVENYGAGWAVRDLGSRNGTYVNGERVLSERALRSGDELRIGKTRLIFRDHAGSDRDARHTVVLGGTQALELTRRERDVLAALCRPLASTDPFTQPASIKDIAGELVVTEAAVKQHLLHLYDKFGLDDRTENRRIRLANEVILRGLLNPAELRREG
jgi:pSer/pThr/pTyr-binding forkhead associated (FHA) protein